MSMIPAEPHSNAALSPAPSDAPLDDSVHLDYRTMPPKDSFLMSVELDVRGRGKPLPFDLDDGVPE